MTKKEALRLLRGGRDGIGKWNSRRDAGEETPSLGAARLAKGNLAGADLGGADLRGANLTNADLRSANLTEADLANTGLIRTQLHDCILTNANLRHAHFGFTLLADVDLSEAVGLGEVSHFLDCIINDERPFPDLEDAAKTQAICFAADLSAESGRAVRISEITDTC